MKNIIFAWVICFVLLMSLDFVWLSLSMKSFYKPQLAHLFKEDLSYFLAILFYFIYAFGISYLIVLPGLLSYTALEVLFRGFILGIMAYGAYDLTNQATLKDWPVLVTVIDMLWGGTLTALTSLFGYFIMMYIYKK